MLKVHNAESVKVGLENKLKEKEKEMKEENIRSADQVTANHLSSSVFGIFIIIYVII